MALALRCKDEAATLKSQLEQLQSELATERDGRATDVSKALKSCVISGSVFDGLTQVIVIWHDGFRICGCSLFKLVKLCRTLRVHMGHACTHLLGLSQRAKVSFLSPAVSLFLLSGVSLFLLSRAAGCSTLLQEISAQPRRDTCKNCRIKMLLAWQRAQSNETAQPAKCAGLSGRRSCREVQARVPHRAPL